VIVSVRTDRPRRRQGGFLTRSAPFTASIATAVQFSSGEKHVAIAAPDAIDDAEMTGEAAATAREKRA
jgi:hypothetical protein